MAYSSSPKSGPPKAVKESDRSLERVGFGTVSLKPPSTVAVTSVSVIRAAPWAIFLMRSRMAALSVSLGARTKYSSEAHSCTTLGASPPQSRYA